MRKKTPLWFFIVVIIFLIYGSISIYMNDTMSGMQLLRLAVVNIMITLIFIVFNIVMWYWFVDKGYEIEAIVLVSYYIIINVLNALNIYFGWIDDYALERNISIGTKVFEVVFIGRMLWKRYGYQFLK